MRFECPRCGKTFITIQFLHQHIKDKNHQIEFRPTEREPLNPEHSSLSEPIIVTRDDLPSEVLGFKCPDCRCEQATYDTSHAPLYSKRSYLIIKCSKCGKGFRDPDF
ncbi:MAG: hypothetical protein ACFFAS_07320 [Promethearchaeota archaeon]